ncbi:hypothetical protein ACLB2K_022614 [Fragaria x ananassa]
MRTVTRKVLIFLPTFKLGGMETATIARCSYRAVTLVIPLFEHTKYADMRNEISSRFEELEVGGFELTFSIPEHPNIMLESDMDMHMMLMFLSMVKSRFVDILVKDLESSKKEDVARAVSGQAADNPAFSDHAASDHSASNCAAFNNTASDLAVPNHEMSNDAASNHAASDPALPKHATSNIQSPIPAISDFAASNHVSSSSCMVESKFIDENEYLGNSGVHEGNAYLSQGWKEYINHVGQKFEGGAAEFRNKLCKYAFEMGFRIRYLRNYRTHVIAECRKKLSDGCSWRIHACKCQVNAFFYLRTLNNVHTCERVIFPEQASKLTTSMIISSVLVDQIREKPYIKPTDIVKDFKQKYGLDVSYRKAWLAKELAKRTVHGDESLSYRQPLLFIDVTFLKSKYDGYLISATGKDGNQDYSYMPWFSGTFPFAFGIVDSENEENWSWFFNNLSIVLTAQGRTITLVSGCNKGLAESVSKIFPASHHASCLQYLKQKLFSIYSSMYGKSFGNRIVDLFLNFLEDHPKEYWSYIYFEGNRYGEMCRKLSGSFSSWVFELCTLPICQMVDGIMIKLMELMAEKRFEAEEWKSVLCPEIEKTLNNDLMVCRNYKAYRSSRYVFEVHAGYSMKVDLDNRFCSCHEWQINGFPCAHALVSIQQNNGCIYDYVEDYFKTSYFRSSYATLMSPILDINVMHEIPDDVVIMPPLAKRR